MKVTRSGLQMAALFGIVALCWGGTYVALKVGLPYSRPFSYAAIRTFLGGIAVALVAWSGKRRFPRDPSAHGLCAVLGLLNASLFIGLLNTGIAARGISAGMASILTYTQPLMVAALAGLFLGERLGRRAAAGLAIGFAGMAVALGGGIHVGGAPLWSYLALLGSAFSWALGTVLYKRVHGRIDLLWNAALQSLYGTIPLGITAYVLDHGLVLRPVPLALLALAHLALFSSGLAPVLYFYLLARHKATEVSAYIFVVPLTAVILGAILLHEHPSPLLIVGGAGVLAGIYLVNSAQPPAGETEPLDADSQMIVASSQ